MIKVKSFNWEGGFFMFIKMNFNGHMESLIKNSSPVGVKFAPEFLMSISWCLFGYFAGHQQGIVGICNPP